MMFPYTERCENRNFQKELDRLLESSDATIKKRLLLHCCCAPCSSYVLEYLYPYFNITVFFYNPNITREEEYIKRKEELKRYLSCVSFGNEIHIMDADYEPERFLAVAKGKENCPERGERCTGCFLLRLSKTAERAAADGYDYFCTTLSISPHKNASLLMAIGEQLAKQYKIAYLPSDFKKKNGYKRSIELSKEYKLYRQDYCGCIYSEQASKKKKALSALRILLLACCLFLAGCSKNTDPAPVTQTAEETGKAVRQIFAMDTIMDITVYGDDASEAAEEAVPIIQRMEREFSVTNPSSDIAKLNAADGRPVKVSDDTYRLIRQALNLSAETDGLFDLSVYPLVKAWGFTTDQMHIPDRKEIKKTLSLIDYQKITLLDGNKIRLDEGMELDMGAAAKGYLSQKLMDMFRKKGVESALVSLGGNVQTIGTKENGEKFVIGITDPADGSSVYGTLEVSDKAVVTSGIYQRYFEENGIRYHHIMDKRTGKPAENNLASVTVIADDGCQADALATALYVMGEEQAFDFQKKHPEIEIIVIRKDGTFRQSNGAGMTVDD